MKSFSQTPRGATKVLVREVRAVMVSAARVHSWLGAVEVQTLKGLSVHRYTRTVSTGDGGRSRIVQYVLLEMSSSADGVLLVVQVCSVLEPQLPCTLRGRTPPRRSDGTCAAGTCATDFLSNGVASDGVTLRSDTAVEEVV